jgi:predicted nuclease with RNAse H fold
MATIEWLPNRAVVRDLVIDVGDVQIVKASQHADKIGLDCPLGWPEPFVALITAHRSGLVPLTDGAGAQWRRRLAFRLTDEVVREETGIVPLSVAADRIAHAAFRCARLLAMLAADGHDVDRCGGGGIVEVYPAATLRRWGLTHRGYKGRGQEVQHADLVTGLCAAAPWLELGASEAPCRRSHDAFDSVIAALCARAAAIGKVTWPNDGQRVAARTEGWIALPTCQLAGLIDKAEA